MEELLSKFKVGNTAVIGLSTEDEDLNEFLDEYGNRIVITEIEEEDGEPTGNFWGVQLTHKVHCPYHLELMDVTNIDETNYNVEDFADFKTLKEPYEVEAGDTVRIKSIEEYEDNDDEITELVEKFAGKELTVTSVNHALNEFGEISFIAKSEEGDLISFTEHEIAKVLG
jgi:hypothetical protein